MALQERIYRSLYRIRRVEEEVARIYPTDKIKSPVHLSIGQEAAAVGICEHLHPQDVVFCSYRSHAAYLAKGGDLRRMFAELFGKVTGCAKGKGGSMHIVDVEHGIMGASAVVGTTIANAVGFAYAVKLQRRNAIVVSFFGDGATDEGVFHESMNFAALKRLPIVFLCENNLYAIHTHQRKRQAQTNIAEKAEKYGMPSERVEGNDVLALYEKAGRVVEALRAGEEGPFFFECMTYRWKEHVGANEDYELNYRSRGEAEPWIRTDQVARLAALIEPGARQRIEREAEDEISDAIAFAEASPFPDGSELLRDLFKENAR